MKLKSGLGRVPFLLVGFAFLCVSGLIVYWLNGADRSGTQSCLSNLRQIGAALRLYGESNDGMAPPFLTRTISSNDGKAVIAKQPKLWRATLEGFSKDGSVFFCPLDKVHGIDPAFSGNWDSEFTSYQTTGIPSPGRSQFGKGGAYMLSLEEAVQMRVAYLQDILYPNFQNLKPGQMRTLHGQNINNLYVDGHVENVAFCK